MQMKEFVSVERQFLNVKRNYLKLLEVVNLFLKVSFGFF
jgi:hypothetical protein